MAAPTALRPARRVTLQPDPGTGSGGRVVAVAGWPGQRPLLADVVPVFERLGVRVADAVALPGADGVAPSRLELVLPESASPDTALPALEQALAAAWPGRPSSTGCRG
ncbi:hypothetical protein [Geodermatophilus saharensis]|uniref:hypothetical protein n=1 Tax=Geodermatophilus saharensis TaxID=1137994 RepID=UPI001FE41643|nr:hypothetical protein [Geodermatophilus saharensis]